ncbi:hypothetical protein ES705_38200 [subsurface metagenome]
MEALPGPYELLELEDGGALETRIIKWQTGEVEIHPAYKPEGKMIMALRIEVPEEHKDYFPYYWDITSQTLLAQLLPHLEQPGFERKTFRITKHGMAPRARFSLEVR